MYCVKCGVRMSEGQTLCPICGTRVYHPDIKNEGEPTYPKKPFKSEEFNPKGVLFVITVIMAVAMLVPLLFELTWHMSINWSGYAVGGILLAYIFFILPFWFKKGTPAIFAPCDVLAIVLYLHYINYQVEGNWFLYFAMPLTVLLGVIVTAVIVLAKYIRRGWLYIFGGGLIALGLWTVAIEHLIHVVFGIRSPVVWSSCSFSTLFLFGMMLIIIAIVKPLRESLRRIFFVGKYKS